MKLFGKAERMPETLAELRELCPELVAQAVEEGRQGVDVEALKAEAVKEAQGQAAAQVERIYGIIGAAINSDAADQIRVIVDSGVTVEQFKAVGRPLAVTESDSEKELALKAGLLEAIKSSGAENPGHDRAGPRKEQWNRDADALAENQEKINAAITQYQKEHPEADYRAAALAVAQAQPELFRNR